MTNNNLGSVVGAAVNGGHRPAITHRVSGVNVRGERFSLDRTEREAVDFAREIRELGGTATVVRLSVEGK